MQNCDLCNKELQEVNDEIKDGKCLKFKDGDEEYFVIRCDECFSKNKGLTKYKKTEVYSRVCGYMRPLNQWHKGKQEEYKDRKEFLNK